MSSQSLKEKGLTPTDCANLYVRFCLQNLPYNADAFREVADVAPLTGTQYKAVQKALQNKLTSLIKRLDKSLGKQAPAGRSMTEVSSGQGKLSAGPQAI